MAKVTRFNLVLDVEEVDRLSRAASLTGTTLADFVRNAAKEKARILLEQESCVTFSERDFLAFNVAISGAFAPNPALQAALKSVGQVKPA